MERKPKDHWGRGQGWGGGKGGGAAWKEEGTPAEKLKSCFWKVLNSHSRLRCVAAEAVRGFCSRGVKEMSRAF